MSLDKKNAQIVNQHFGVIQGAFFVSDSMENITECAKLFKTLLNKNFIFTLEGNIKFELFFKPQNFYHMIGLHKLKDLKQLKGQDLSLIFKKILNGAITQEDIERSSYYSAIVDRIIHFQELLDMLNPEHSKIIIDFDYSKVKNGTKLLNTKYILYKYLEYGYINLTICEVKNKLFPETFFFEKSKMYISEQTLLDIINIDIVDKKKKHN